MAASASRESAPAVSSASSRPPAASTASADQAVANALLPTSASPSPAARLGPAEQPGGEVGHRRQVGLADRAERADRGHAVAVERIDQPVGQRRPHPGGTFRERVREAQGRAAGQLRRRRGPWATHGRGSCGARTGGGLAADVDPLEDADGGAEAVDGLAGRQGALGDGPGRRHSLDAPPGPGPRARGRGRRGPGRRETGRARSAGRSRCPPVGRAARRSAAVSGGRSRWTGAQRCRAELPRLMPPRR